MAETTENSPEKPEKKKRRTVKRANRKGVREEDANFAQKSRVFRKLFEINWALFNAKDPSLNLAYAAEWLTTIEEFESHETDETIMDEMQYRTDCIKEFIEKVLPYVDELEYFVGKAFPKDERLPYEFAFDLIRKEAIGTDTKFLIHCFVSLEIAADYSAELLAAGWPASSSADFYALLETGSRVYMDLEKNKRLRIRATTKRVALYNQLHEYWRKVNRAAQLVYRNDAEALAMWNR